MAFLDTEMHERCLREGVTAPDLATVKDFIRFHAHTSGGKMISRRLILSISQRLAVSYWGRDQLERFS
jgi:hypothetical protein